MRAPGATRTPHEDLPTLVFAHHFGGSGRSWRAVSDRLGGRFDCRTPDLSGFGGSPPPADLDLDAYASELEAVSDRPHVLIGHSMGAKIAMTLAARRPASLRGLILITPSPPTPEPMEEHERGEFLAELGDRAKAGERIDGLTSAPLPDDTKRAYVDDQLSVAPAAWRWWLEDGSRIDVSSRLVGLKLPVLVIAAADDPVLPLASTLEVAKAFAGSELRVVAGSGHLVPAERPDQLAALIEDFVQSLTVDVST